jgi:hypothetical protein
MTKIASNITMQNHLMTDFMGTMPMSDKKDDINSTAVPFPKEKRKYNKVNRATKDKSLEKLNRLNNLIELKNKINSNNNNQYDPNDMTKIPNMNCLLNLTPTGKIRSP